MSACESRDESAVAVQCRQGRGYLEYAVRLSRLKSLIRSGGSVTDGSREVRGGAPQFWLRWSRAAERLVAVVTRQLLCPQADCEMRGELPSLQGGGWAHAFCAVLLERVQPGQKGTHAYISALCAAVHCLLQAPSCFSILHTPIHAALHSLSLLSHNITHVCDTTSCRAGRPSHHRNSFERLLAPGEPRPYSVLISLPCPAVWATAVCIRAEQQPSECDACSRAFKTRLPGSRAHRSGPLCLILSSHQAESVLCRVVYQRCVR